MKKFFSFVAAMLFAGSMMAATETLNCPVGTVSEDAMTFQTDNFTFVHAKGTSSNFAAYHPWRVYSGNTITITGGQFVAGITKVELAHSSSYWSKEVTSDQGTVTMCTENSGTTVIDEFASGVKELTITVGAGETSGQDRFLSITITFDKAEVTTPIIVANDQNLGVIPVGLSKEIKLNVTGLNLTQAIVASMEEGSASRFEVSGDLTAEGGELTIVATAAAAGAVAENLILKAGEEATLTVALSFNAIATLGDGSEENPFTCADLTTLANGWGGKHWVTGIIVENNDANIALASTAGADKEVSVQLGATSSLREALNPVVGMSVKALGSLESYNSLPGVKNLDTIYSVTPPTPVELDIVASQYLVYDADGYFDLFLFSSDTWSFDYNNGWTVGEAGYALILDMVYTDMTDVTGTYSSADGSLDASYSSFVSWDGASENLTVAKLASGTVTIAWKDESHSAYVVTYDVIDVNGVNYKGTAEVDPYEEEEPPTADTEVTTSVADATLEDYLSDEYFVVSGTDADGVYFQLLFYPATAIEGSFTEEDLYASSSAVVVGEDVYAIYSATITIVANADGSYTITADLLCYNNTLYHLTMTVPASPAEGIEEILATGKAVKVVRDGQVVVLKTDKAFNMNGQIVK